MTLSNCCGAGTRHNPDPQSTSGLLCVKCKLNCCDIKPMKHEVKVGDRFKLGPWEWTVQEIYSASINAYHHKGGDFYHKLTLWLTDADQLDWIKPEPTCSKEFAEALHKELVLMCNLDKEWASFARRLKDWLSSHTEKDGDKPLY